MRRGILQSNYRNHRLIAHPFAHLFHQIKIPFIGRPVPFIAVTAVVRGFQWVSACQTGPSRAYRLIRPILQCDRHVTASARLAVFRIIPAGNRRLYEAYRLLLNIFRTGLFENPYLNLEESLHRFRPPCGLPDHTRRKSETL